MDIKNLLQSKKFRSILFGLVIIVIVLVIFQAGIFVGYYKASFSYRWGNNYHQTFGARERNMPMMGMFRGGFANPHGASGKIIKIVLPNVIVEDQDDVEKSVLITDDTEIREFRNLIKPEDLKVNDFIIVIGSPNDDGEIQARLIRLMPANMMNTTTTSIK